MDFHGKKGAPLSGFGDVKRLPFSPPIVVLSGNSWDANWVCVRFVEGTSALVAFRGGFQPSLSKPDLFPWVVDGFLKTFGSNGHGR